MSEPRKLEEYTIAELSAEVKRRGWRIIPESYAKILAVLGRGLDRGYYPRIKEPK